MKKVAKKSAKVVVNTKQAASSDAPVAASSSAPAVAGVSLSTSASVSDVPIQLQALEARCGYGNPLSDEDRKTSDNLIRRVPTSIVERIMALAVRGGGVVAGIKFDPTAAKAALAAADEADAVATAGEMLVRRAQDQSIRLRAGVTSNVAAIRTSMRGYAKTAQGASLVQENEEIRSLAKQAVAARKARKTRAENAADTASPPAPTEAETPPPAGTPAPPPPPPTTPHAS